MRPLTFSSRNNHSPTLVLYAAYGSIYLVLQALRSAAPAGIAKVGFSAILDVSMEVRVHHARAHTHMRTRIHLVHIGPVLQFLSRWNVSPEAT